MIEVDLKYKEERMTVSFPATWNELTEHQLMYVSKYWLAWKDLIKLGESMRKARALLLIELSGLRKWSEKKKFCDILSHVDERTNVNLLDLTNFIFEKNDLTRNMVPRIRVGVFTQYYGPADKLADISIDEFSFALNCYSNYARTENVAFLNKLVAVLYRPGNGDYSKSGERKTLFNNKMIPLYERKIEGVKDERKEAVYLFFTGCMEYLAKRYPIVFRRADKDAKAGSSFVDTIVAMSGGKFGPFEETRRQNLYLVLSELDRLLKENEEHRRKK